MTQTVRAVYEGGIFRPIQSPRLPDGKTVELTINDTFLEGAPFRAPTPAEEDYTRRTKAAKSLEELFKIMETAPPSPEGYDLGEALNANRKATGERMLFLEANGGSAS